ncbi:MAG: hypothetical protein QXE78_05180 [Nitrososphaeria archaeon]
MPSHNVHLKAAEIFEIPTEKASYVDRLVDSGILHDLGRRLPHVSQYYWVTGEDVLTEIQFRKISITKETAKILKSIKDQDFSDVFYLHHAIDLLGSKYVSATLLGINLDAIASNIITSILGELEAIGHRIYYSFPAGPVFSKDFSAKLQELLPKVWHTNEIFSWAISGPIPKRKELDSLELISSILSESVKKLYRTGLKLTDAQVKGFARYASSASKGHIKVEFEENEYYHTGPARNYAMGRAIRMVCKLACLRSRVIDCSLLTPYPTDVTIDRLLCTRKKLSLCNETIDYIKRLSEDQAKEAVEKALKNFEVVWLQKHGIKLPELSAAKYFETLKTGWKIINTEL